jgi:tetratricopeptide (TPR) repeat protein
MGSGSENPANTAEIDRLALALVKDPESKAFIPLAEEYGKAGMWDEAAAVLEEGLKAFPNFITAMVALGRVYDQVNQPVKAIALLEEAVKLSPENLRAHRTLAKMYAAQGQQEAALRSCRVILSANPQDQEAVSISTMLSTSPSPTATREPAPQQSAGIGSSVLEMIVPPITTQDPSSSDVASHAHAETSSSGSVPSPEQKRAAVVKLEQYLALIRSRRLGQEASSDHHA